MFLASVNQVLGRHLDAQVDDLVAVVGQDDVHQVLADVVDVALDGGQDYLTLAGGVGALHVRLQVSHGEFHRLGGLEHFGHDKLVGVELAAHLVHAGHQRAVNHFQGRPALKGFIQVIGQALLGAFNDGQRQPLVQGKVSPLLGGGLGSLVAEMGSKGGHRVLAPVPDKVFGQLPFLFRNRRVPLHHLRVDDGRVQPRLYAVVEEDGVKDFAAGGRQAERNVGNPQHRLGVGQGFLDEPHSLDGFRGGPDVVFVAGTGREYQGVKNQVFFRYAILFRKQFVGAERNFQLAFPGDGLGLFLVVVNAADHQSRAVGTGQGSHRLEPGLAVLQVYRVDDGLTLQPLQRLFDYGRVGGVDHYRTLYFLGDQVEEFDDVGHFVPVGVLQTYVQDVGAVSHLAATDFGGFLKGTLAN